MNSPNTSPPPLSTDISARSAFRIPISSSVPAARCDYRAFCYGKALIANSTLRTSIGRSSVKSTSSARFARFNTGRDALGNNAGGQKKALEPCSKELSAMTSAAVGREDLERQLEVVRALAPGEMEGVFGPDSLTWRIDREALRFLGAGRALLLQLAHPWVDSRPLGDPIGRFHRTIAVVLTMVFGTLDQALSAARALHRRHAAIHGRLPITVGPFRAGSPYQANDLAALRWIYATLVETALMTHDFVLPPLTGEERARYYAESHRFAALFGIPRATLPADWREFATYAEMMRESDVLTVSPAAHEIARQVFSGAGSLLLPPQWVCVLTWLC